MNRKTAVSVENRQSKVPVKPREIKRSLTRLLELLEFTDAEVSVTLVDDDEIRTLNNRYLQRDRPTNVISFSMLEGAFGDITPNVLGDIVMSAETASRDAHAGGLPPDDMILYLVIHGLLHLLGYDHEVSLEEATRMLQKENELFFALRNYHLAQQ